MALIYRGACALAFVYPLCGMRVVHFVQKDQGKASEYLKYHIVNELYPLEITFVFVRKMLRPTTEEKDASWYHKYNNPTVIPQYIYLVFRHLLPFFGRIWNKNMLNCENIHAMSSICWTNTFFR